MIVSPIPPLVLLLALMAVSVVQAAAPPPSLRPPSVPLVACDPYFSIWSPADKLTDAETVHWTGKAHPLHSMIRVGDNTYRLMGREPQDIPALPQTDLQVLPTRTLYTFANEQVQVTLTFMTPALPDDLDVLSRPVTYLTWDVRSADGKGHSIALYFDAAADLVVNEPNQKVTWGREKVQGMTTLRMGSEEQPVLGKSGDDLRIDWGYLYAAAALSPGIDSVIKMRSDMVHSFQNGYKLDRSGAIKDPVSPSLVTPQPSPAPVLPPVAAKDAPALGFQWTAGSVDATKTLTHTLLLAYDDLYSIEYFHEHLRPYWRRNGMDAKGLLRQSLKEQNTLLKRCTAFDSALMDDLRKSGGEGYAQIASLAYRQSLAASKVAADRNGAPLFFPKENFSNGCIATVDIIYPMAPQYLLTSPALVKAMLVPVLDYAASPRWKWPFAPHDLGTYPKADGQVYGGGERTEENQMPVEESGNILILLAAIARMDGNARFSEPYWPELKKWAEYLREKGLDPENQLSTDDFAGHLAHNVNLSVKAILALRSYALLAEMRGLSDEAAEYQRVSQEFADTIRRQALDGDHYRLAFDRPGTWSQKYNLVWDQIFDFGLFPEEVRRTEMAYYRTMQNEYGLPLDNRRDYTKLDWILWTATLGTREDFDALVQPVYQFLNATPDRVPMTDWYNTKTAKKQGFQARSVVGGVFLKLLHDQATWRKWAGRGENVLTHTWAALPKPPVITAVVPTSQEEALTWRYTVNRPAEGWFRADFDDSEWLEGPGGFGTRGTPGSVVRTEWSTGDIWIRREFTLPNVSTKNLQLFIHHDEDAEVYLNGVPAGTFGGFTGDYGNAPIRAAALAALKPGKNVIAIHCHQTTGGQYIDAGLVTVTPAK